MSTAHMCGICSSQYDSDAKLPKLLVECGHSFCCSCVDALLNGSGRCFLCQESLQEERGIKYPTVTALLDTGEAKIGSKPSESSANKIRQLEDKLKSHQRELAAANRNMKLLKQTEVRLQDTRKFHQHEIDHMMKSLSNIKPTEEGNNVAAETPKDNESVVLKAQAIKTSTPSQGRIGVEKEKNDLKLKGVASSPTLKPNYSLKLNGFKTAQGYKREVCRRLLRGEKVFACYQCQNKLLYAQVSTVEGGAKKDLSPNKSLIKISSVTAVDMEEDSILTPFEDLKKVVEGNFITFLEFMDVNERKGEYIIHLNASPLAKQFVKLCTGEEGPTYKGSKIYYSGHPSFSFKVKTYMKDGAPTSGRLPSTSNSLLASEQIENSGERNVLVGFPDGGFEIKWYDSDYAQMHILSEEIFWYGLASRGEKVTECGIYVPC